MTAFLGERSAFVHRVSRGTARWFFSVSVPLEYLDSRLAISAQEALRKPDELGKAIAVVLDELFRGPS